MKASFLAVGLIALSSIYHAEAASLSDEYTYGFSGVEGQAPIGVQTLILNGTDTIQAFSTGWYSSVGFHSATNPNYIAGRYNSSNGLIFTNDYFAFDLSSVSGPITSAVLSLSQPSKGYQGPTNGLTYTNYDVSTPVSSLVSSQAAATTTYADLGSGTSYGSTLVDYSTNGTQVNITLNSAAISAIASAEGSEFAIGGSLNLSAVPLPASAPMFGAAILGLAGISYAAKRKKAAAAA